MARRGEKTGNGAGWGGPAKGAGAGSPKTDFNAATNAQGHTGATDPALLRAERRRERADALEDHLFKLAFEGEPRDQINASVRLHAICDGMPVARTQLEGNGSGGIAGFVIFGQPEAPNVEEWQKDNFPQP